MGFPLLPLCNAWRAVVLMGLVVAAAGCASVAIDSVPPDAEVAVVLPGEEGLRVLGRSPFRAELADLELDPNNGPITFVIKKRGYLSQYFVMPNLPHTDLKLTATMLPDLPHNYEEVNKVVALVLKGQRHLLEKRFDEALKDAAAIKAINENVASAHEIDGAVHFLRNELRDARYAWIRVLDLEPDNHEAKGMLKLVETRMGLTPAARKDASNAAPAAATPEVTPPAAAPAAPETTTPAPGAKP